MIFCKNLTGGRAMRVDRAERRRFWEKHIEKWESSGLSQADYCRQNGVNIKSFHHWKRRTGRLCSKPVLVELPLSGALSHSFTPSAPGSQLCLVNDRFRIEIGKGFDAEDFERVVRILGLL
jgi:hypothetical protein